jgi:signal peptidase I
MKDRLARVRRSRAFEVVFVVAVALGLALSVQAYAVKPFRIPSESMEPTLRVGDRVLVDRFSHRLLDAKPSVGDIIVFHPPAGADASPPECEEPGQGGESPAICARSTSTASAQTFIKRVVGVAGDRIAVRDGRVVRNGELQAEPFAAPCGAAPACDFPRAIEVPEGTVFVMGDNRGASQDSRFWGPVPISWVLGRAVAVYWPPSHLGTP